MRHFAARDRSAILSQIWSARGLWLGPLAAALAFQATLSLNDETARTADAFELVLAGVLAVVAWGSGMPTTRAEQPRHVGRAWRLDRVTLARAGGVVLALALAALANLLFLANPGETFGAAGWLWLLSMIVLPLAEIDWRRTATTPPALAPEQKDPSTASRLALLAEPAGIVGLLLLALVLRVWDLRDFPYAIYDDEWLTGSNALAAFGSGIHPSVFQTIWSGIDLPALWFALVAASLKIGAGTLAALRLPTALVGAATVVPFYGMMRVAWGRATAIAGTAILAVSASNLQYSRVTINNMLTPFFWSICFFFVLRGLRTRRPIDWVLAGMAGGLSEYGYYGTHLLPFILVAFACYLPVVYGRQIWRLLPSLGLLAVGYLVAFGPLLAWYVRNPHLYFGRGQGALTWDHIPRSWQDLGLMWRTLEPILSANLLGFSTYRDLGGFWEAPLLFPAEAALLVLGAALLLWHWREPAAFLMLLSGIGTIIVGGTLVHGIRNMQHWTPAFPAIYAAIALPIGAWIASIQAVPWRWAPRASVVAPALLLVLLGWRNIDFYFFHFDYSHIDDSSFELRAAQSRWEAALGTRYIVRTVGATWQTYSADFNSYLIRGQDGGALYNPAAELPLPHVGGKGLAFLFFGDEVQYRPIVQALYPGGTPGEVLSHHHDFLFYFYRVAPGKADVASGVFLDIRWAGVRHWHGLVAGFGSLPADVHGPLQATWSGSFYLPQATTVSLSFSGATGQTFFDGHAGLPESSSVAPGWHQVVIAASLSSPRAMRLDLGVGGLHTASIPRAMLRPTAPDGGLIGTVITAGKAHATRLDPFIGFTALSALSGPSDPLVLGPGWIAPPPLHIQWAGDLYAPTTGLYTLMVRTDGQASLAIDGRTVLHTGGSSAKGQPAHSMWLSAGWHPLRLEYHAQPGGSVLELYWTPPGGAPALIPAANLRHTFSATTHALASASTLPMLPDSPPGNPGVGAP